MDVRDLGGWVGGLVGVVIRCGMVRDVEMEIRSSSGTYSG